MERTGPLNENDQPTPPPTRDRRSPHRYEMRHYCRHCLTRFEPTPGQFPSSHARYLLHVGQEHKNIPGQSIACGTYCYGREQADEKQHGVKLYGPGSTSLVELVPLIMTYDQLFPEEGDE